MIRAVLDTNVIVSALLSKKLSPPLKLYFAITRQDFVLVTSADILEEIEEVINREETVKLHKLFPARRKAIVQKLALLSYVVPGKVAVEVVKDDRDDNKIIACALEGKAGYIVSGDHHLLDLKKYQEIRIVTPAAFLRLLQSPSDES